MAGTHFGGRTLARSQAMQLLFQAEATGRTVSDVLEGDYALDEGPLDPYARQLALGCDSMLHELDAVTSVTSANWSVSRMPAVDRNLVRLALYEMLKVDEVDTAVAIDECVELAKAYGTDESSRFVNGLLGKVARRMAAGEDVVAMALQELSSKQPEDGFEPYVPADAYQPLSSAQGLDQSPAQDSDEEQVAPVAQAAGDDAASDADTDDAAADDASEQATFDEDDLPDWVKG